MVAQSLEVLPRYTFSDMHFLLEFLFNYWGKLRKLNGPILFCLYLLV